MGTIMNKLALAFFLAVLSFSLTSCYETVQLKHEELAQINNHDDIGVFVDSAGTVWEARMSGGMYSVVHDTIVGTGSVMTMSGKETQSKIVIPISRIDYVEVRRLNVTQTLILAGGAVGATIAITLLASSPGASAASTSSPQQPH